MSTIFVLLLTPMNVKWLFLISFSLQLQKKKIFQEALVREANNAIQKYKEAYETNKKKDTSENQLKQFKEKFESDKIKAEEQFNTYKNQMQEREA